MHVDLETLAIAPYVKVDDALKTDQTRVRGGRQWESPRSCPIQN